MGICCTTLNHLPPPNLWFFYPVAQEAHVRVFHKSKDYEHPPPVSFSMQPSKKYFSHPSVVTYLSATPNGDCKQVGTSNSKPPRPIIITDRSKIGTSNHIIFITLFSTRCTTFAALLLYQCSIMPLTKCLIHDLSHASCVKEWAKPSSLYIVKGGLHSVRRSRVPTSHIYYTFLYQVHNFAALLLYQCSIMTLTKCLIHDLSHASCVKEWAKPSSLYIVK
jgi:hypothetical protein